MDHSAASNIREQIQLPTSVALEVVLQGVRIRLGRSMVTLGGIMLGVAFLMSVLTSNFIRAGVAEETAARQDTVRMMGFLTADSGPLRGRVLTVLATGPAADAEVRLLRAIESAGISEIRWLSVSPDASIPPRLRVAAEVQTLDAAGQDASAVLLVGPAAPPAETIASTLAPARQRVVVSLHPQPPGEMDARFVHLARAPNPEEEARAAETERKEQARSIWIVSIALLVTVICISNSLLMSVTERFREIGTMKCLGALSSFIRRMYFLESSLLGLIGSIGGAIAGLLFAIIMYSFTYGFALSFSALSPGPVTLLFVCSVVGGLIASILAAIYPATFASRMVPATALRTNI